MMRSTKLTIAILLLFSVQLFSHDNNSWVEEIMNLQKTAKEYLISNPDTSLTLITHALIHSKDEANDSLIARSYYYLGIAHYYKGNYFVSANQYRQALNTGYARTNEEFRAVVYNNLGVVYDLTEQYNLALDSYLKSMEIEASLDNAEGQALCQVNIGLLYLNLKQPEQGNEYLQKARQYFEQSNDLDGLALTFHNLGKLASEMNKLDTAIVYFEKAASLYKKAENLYEYTNILNQLGLYYIGLGNLKKAEALLDTAFGLAKDKGYEYLESTILLSQAKLLIFRKNFDQAEVLLMEVQPMNQRTGFKKKLLELKLACHSKNIEHFDQYLDDLVVFSDSMQIISNNHLVNELHIQYNTEKNLNEITRQREMLVNRKMIIHASITALVVLTILFVVIFFYYQRLQKSYKALFNKEKLEHERFLNKIKIPESTPVEKDENSSLSLYRCIIVKMNTDKRFTNSSLTAEDIARLCNSNKTYVYQAIKAHTGEKFFEFVNRFRVEEAKRLLADNSDLNAEAIADASGFNSKSTFYRTFKEYTGLVPGKYRAYAIRQN